MSILTILKLSINNLKSFAEQGSKIHVFFLLAPLSFRGHQLARQRLKNRLTQAPRRQSKMTQRCLTFTHLLHMTARLLQALKYLVKNKKEKS